LHVFNPLKSRETFTAVIEFSSLNVSIDTLPALQLLQYTELLVNM